MAIDERVATRITELKAKWDTATTGNAVIQGFGDISMYMPVDLTSVAPVKIPGRLARLCGFTKDETPAAMTIWKPAPKEYTRKDTNRAVVPQGSGRSGGKSTGFYRVYVNLKTPVAYTRKTKTVTLKQVGVKVPYIVPIAGVMIFLNKHSDAAKKPPSFETVNRTYQVLNIDYTDPSLGEKTDGKSEGADQASTPVTNENNSKK